MYVRCKIINVWKSVEVCATQPDAPK